MKIAVITPYYPPADGGIALYVKEIVSSFIRTGADVLVFTREGDDKNPYVFKINKGKMSFIFSVFWAMRNIKLDVVHAHSGWYTLASGVIYKLFHRRTKLYYTFLTGLTDNDFRGVRKRLFRWLLSKCDCVTYISEALMNDVQNRMNLSMKSIVIYPGVTKVETNSKDIDLFIKANNLENKYPIITFLGPFEWPQKVEGIKLLIRAFKEVKETHINSKLLLIGDGSLRNELEELVDSLDLKKHVIFVGYVPNAFVPLNVSSIHTHISLQEGLPLSLLEAMSIGLPVVASRTGGIPEVIINGENGLLVNSDVKSISEAILRIAENNDLYTNLSNQAKETINLKYSWSNTSNHLLGLYRGEQT